MALDFGDPIPMREEDKGYPYRLTVVGEESTEVFLELTLPQAALLNQVCKKVNSAGKGIFGTPSYMKLEAKVIKMVQQVSWEPIE